MSVLPGDFFCGWLCRNKAGAKWEEKGCGQRREFVLCQDVISHANRATAAIPARIISASPWCKTKWPRRRYCIASSPCLVEDVTGCDQQIAASTSSLSLPSMCERSSGGA